MRKNTPLKYFLLLFLALISMCIHSQDEDILIITSGMVITDLTEDYVAGVTPEIRVFNVDTVSFLVTDTLSCMVAVDIHFDTIGAKLGSELKRTYADRVRVIYKKNRVFSQEETSLIEQLVMDELHSKRLWASRIAPIWPPFFPQLVSVKISPYGRKP